MSRGLVRPCRGRVGSAGRALAPGLSHLGENSRMDLSAATTKLQALRRDMNGHTDRTDERRILDLLEGATGEELNFLLANVDLVRLLSDLDDRLLGPDHRTALLELLCARRAAELSLPVRASLATALQKGATRAKAEARLRDLFLGLKGRELTAFKNLLDAGGDSHDLHHLVFDDVDDPAVREALLTHFQREAAASPSGENKVLSDIDDTFFRNWVDPRYPPKTVYPGVLAFYQELDRGPGIIPGRAGDLVFVSARPRDPLGLIENATLESLRERGVPLSVMLSGSFFHLVGNTRIAQKKFENFEQYARLFPEYGFVFVGDSGQGDVEFGARMRATHPQAVRAVFIHDVVATPRPVRDEWRARHLFFFDTYVGAAVEAFHAGVISRDGVDRIAAAASEALAAIAFPSPARRHEREAELAHDLARAQALPRASAV
ncbi:phosphatase domain-containing protein [Corallococcus silvisoli]|uniref:phosphatase domain-containing protein n=1 Tax=Corallococcus silvisoli TaxID=2697031 RepID=UPI001F385724|nr:phosphatase domain-containing protein [Corallococcus silvisoli]